MTEIVNQVTTGNLWQIAITLGTLLVGVALTWGMLSDKLSVLAKGFDDHESRLRVLEFQITGELAKINAKLGTIEKAVK